MNNEISILDVNQLIVKIKSAVQLSKQSRSSKNYKLTGQDSKGKWKEIDDENPHVPSVSRNLQSNVPLRCLAVAKSENLQKTIVK